MKYTDSGKKINAGDLVFVENRARGLVICDYDDWVCVPGYERWLTKAELVGGGTLSSGIMVESKELGFIHYSQDDDDVVFISSSSQL